MCDPLTGMEHWNDSYDAAESEKLLRELMVEHLKCHIPETGYRHAYTTAMVEALKSFEELDHVRRDLAIARMAVRILGTAEIGCIKWSNTTEHECLFDAADLTVGDQCVVCFEAQAYAIAESKLSESGESEVQNGDD